MTSEHTSIPTKEVLVQRLVSRLFDRSLVQNNVRGELVETIVELALAPTWKHCGFDWAGWDFESTDGDLRIQVRQSAKQQTWLPPASPRPPQFSIRPCKACEYRGRRHRTPERHAHLYVLAWHAGVSSDADHRDAAQWRFFVIATKLLPLQQTISLSAVKRLCGDGVRFDELSEAVSILAAELRSVAGSPP